MTTTTTAAVPVTHHFLWAVLLIGSLLGYKSWRDEHEARVAADAVVKTSQTQIQTLQEQIAARDKAAAVQQAPIIKIIHDTTTVQQAAQALPSILTAPLPKPIVVNPDNSVEVPEPDVLPLFDVVADDRLVNIQLATANSDLIAEKGIVAQQAAEIVALKKKPSFWHRVGGTAKAVGIGIGIGVVIGAKL
jgi:hypothetical protein